MGLRCCKLTQVRESRRQRVYDAPVISKGKNKSNNAKTKTQETHSVMNMEDNYSYGENTKLLSYSRGVNIRLFKD